MYGVGIGWLSMMTSIAWRDRGRKRKPRTSRRVWRRSGRSILSSGSYPSLGRHFRLFGLYVGSCRNQVQPATGRQNCGKRHRSGGSWTWLRSFSRANRVSPRWKRAIHRVPSICCFDRSSALEPRSGSYLASSSLSELHSRHQGEIHAL